MGKVEARSVLVPFRVFRPNARVKVWLLPTTAVEDDVALAVLVDLSSFLRCGIEGEFVEPKIAPEALVDRRAFASEFGVTSQGPLVTYRDLSRYGWGLQAQEGVRTAKASYWTVFFAQNLVRGLCLRLIGAEMECLWKDAQGEEVYFNKLATKLRREAKAYRRIKPLGDISPWVRHEVEAMWRRVGDGLTLDVNRKALTSVLKHGNVTELKREVEDDNVSVS